MSLPECVTEERHTRGFGPVLFRREGPPQLRRQAKCRKHVGRNQKTFQFLRFAFPPPQIETASPKSNQMFESLRLRLPFEVTLYASAHDGVTTFLSFCHPEQPLRLVVRHGIEQHCIDDAEDRRVRPNTERQRDDGNQREDRMLEQHSQRVAYILPQRFKLIPRARFPNFLFNLLPAPKLDQGHAASRCWIETFVDLLLDEHLQIGVNLLRQFPFLPGLLEQVAPET